MCVDPLAAGVCCAADDTLRVAGQSGEQATIQAVEQLKDAMHVGAALGLHAAVSGTMQLSSNPVVAHTI
jgi:hypothetical protein